MICIGYSTLEEWCKVVDKDSPVYVCLLQETSPSNVPGLLYKKDVVSCCQADSRENVHYFRQTLRTYTSVDMEENSAIEGWQIIKEWLVEKGFTVLEGTVSMPGDLKLLEGYADFLKWDKDKRKYCKGEENAQ